MKRFHVHMHVDDLAKSIAFYSRLFAAEPARVETDYAKWMLEDPRVNFAISTRGDKPGVDHLGFQVDEADELAELKARAQGADMAGCCVVLAACCTAASLNTGMLPSVWKCSQATPCGSVIQCLSLRA